MNEIKESAEQPPSDIQDETRADAGDQGVVNVVDPPATPDGPAADRDGPVEPQAGALVPAEAGTSGAPEGVLPDVALLETATVDSVLGTAVNKGTGQPASVEPRQSGVDDHLKAVIEALVFASPDPLTPKILFKLLEHEPREDVEAALDALRRDYDGHGGLQLVEVAGGLQIVTRPELHEWVRRLFHERKTQKLSVQALETLAVIAYRQPITAPEIAEVRGVNTSGVLSTLLERRLIKIAGRKHVVGRPFLYATTREFLIRFGLKDLGDLPKIEDMADVLGFDAPVGLADTGPSTGTLPLDLEPPAADVPPDSPILDDLPEDGPVN